MRKAKNDVGADQAGEEHDFGQQEDPHADLPGGGQPDGGVGRQQVPADPVVIVVTLLM